MSTMYNVSVSDYAQFDRATALRRCLARGLTDERTHKRLAGFEEWIELRFSVSNCHPDSRCGTSEELFLRLIADANMQAGEKYEHTPVDEYYAGKLFTMGFSIEESECPLAILELTYTPGAPQDKYAGGEDDAVEALVSFPKQFAPNIADVGYFESASWGGARRLDDVARGARWPRKRGEIRLVSASRQGPDFENGVTSLAVHAGSIYAVTRYAKVKGPTRLDKDSSPTVVDIVKRDSSFECVHSDGESLWVGGSGLHQLRDDAVVNSFDIKTGLVGKDVKALTHTSDGTLVVAGSAGFTLIRDGAVVEAVKAGVGLKAISAVAAAQTGELWLGGWDGATRRNQDGSFDGFKSRQHVAGVMGFVCLADGATLIGVQYPAPSTLYVAPGSQRTKPFEPVSDFGCVVAGFEHAGALWLVTSDGMIVKVVDGQPVRAFVLDDVEQRACTDACLAEGVIYLYGRVGVSMIEVSTLEAAMKRPADNVAIHGKRGLVAVQLSERAGATAAAAPSIDVAGKKVCITGTFSRLDRADVSVKLAALGASVVSGVTKATQILFVGDKAGSKLAKAKALGVTVYTEDELIGLIEAGASVAPPAAKKPAAKKPAAKKPAAKKPATSKSANTFAGKLVVVTGTMQTMTRASVTARLEALGAKVGGSVTAKTDLLVVGLKAGSKLAKANSLGVQVMTEDTFIDLVGE